MGSSASSPRPGATTNGDYRERVVPFGTADGLGLNLINVRGPKDPTRGPVMLVHGAGVRANIFRPQREHGLVETLVDRGYDVWLENWRASIDVEPNHWTLDQAALHDHPAAVRTILADTGQDRMKAIVHCQGSTSFCMSAVAGLVPEVDTIVTNAVSLHPVVPAWSRVKLRYATPLVQRLAPFLDPAWGDDPPGVFPRILTLAVKATHRECPNTVCKLVSFTYGSGRPALWLHDNLDAATHDQFIPTEFGPVPLTFFRQMDRCVRRGHLVSSEANEALPADYGVGEPLTDARFVLLAGEHNRCFLPESQRRTFEYFDRHRPRYHALHVLAGYSHLDMFLGRSAPRDVFPLILDGLEGSAPGTTPAGG